MQLYKNFLGLDGDGEELVDPSSGQVTTFMNSGDPITNTGWLGFYQGPPRDVYFMQGSGKFDLAPLDTQRVVYAIIVGHANSRLNSVVDLKRNVNFIRDTFLSEFKIKALAETEVNFTSASVTELKIKAKISSKERVASVQGQLFNYYNSLIHTIDLFDDGQHQDSSANDGIYGNIWQTTTMDDALYLNLKIKANSAKEYDFKHAADYITLSDKLDNVSLTVVDDNINYDRKVNPGENVRLNLELKNNYSFEIGSINIFITSNDPLVELETKHLFVTNIAAGESEGLIYNIDDENSYLSMDVSDMISTDYTIDFNVTIYDDLHHKWQKQVSLKVEPFDYIPNTIIPSHASGHSDAYFKIRVIDPNELTGHSYLISVRDSINENQDKGFNLIDQTSEKTLLFNHPVPKEFAYNVPITDGFKIVEAYLPDGGLKDVYYENISEGNPTGFEGVNFGGDFFDGGVMLGSTEAEEFLFVELEFTNDIDSSGVVGNPLGQSAFRYDMGGTSPSGFFPCPFNMWKIIKGQRIGKLNTCFQENPYFATYDDIWAPDFSNYGGFETLYIMKSEYDPNGLYYQGQKINMDELLYKVNLKLISENSVVDAGDKFIFSWEYAATRDDEFTFIPTNINEYATSELSKAFSLCQNYPNPFNPSTNIKFSVDNQSFVSLKIYNMMGQQITELINENLSPGIHSVHWDGKNKSGQLVSSGLYFAKLLSGDRMKIIKMLLIR